MKKLGIQLFHRATHEPVKTPDDVNAAHFFLKKKTNGGSALEHDDGRTTAPGGPKNEPIDILLPSQRSRIGKRFTVDSDGVTSVASNR